jgi:hypothetical protein
MPSVKKKTVPVIAIAAAAAAAAFALGVAGRAPTAAGPDMRYRNAPTAAGPDMKYRDTPAVLADGSTPNMKYRN